MGDRWSSEEVFAHKRPFVLLAATMRHLRVYGSVPGASKCAVLVMFSLAAFMHRGSAPFSALVSGRRGFRTIGGSVALVLRRGDSTCPNGSQTQRLPAPRRMTSAECAGAPGIILAAMDAAASFSMSRSKWAYRSVDRVLACPNNLPTK